MRPDKPRGLGAVVRQEPTKSQVQILPAPPQISDRQIHGYVLFFSRLIMR